MTVRNKELVISSVFFKYLKRPPSEVEVQYWMSILSAEMSYETMMKEFEDEFRAEITATNLQLV